MEGTSIYFKKLVLIANSCSCNLKVMSSTKAPPKQQITAKWVEAEEQRAGPSPLCRPFLLLCLLHFFLSVNEAQSSPEHKNRDLSSYHGLGFFSPGSKLWLLFNITGFRDSICQPIWLNLNFLFTFVFFSLLQFLLVPQLSISHPPPPFFSLSLHRHDQGNHQ